MPRVRNPANKIVDGHSRSRCIECRMHRGQCLCSLVPLVPTRTRVVLVLHSLESHKTTNTGRLALRCLPNSALVMRGQRDARPQAPR
jgi:DTW domain-containing protein YfiP